MYHLKLIFLSLGILHRKYSNAVVASSIPKKDTTYKIFPQRRDAEAAVVEWGNSAIISAIDAAVASFGPQTYLGAFFEVETTPVLGMPINGRGNKPNLMEQQEEQDLSIPFAPPYPGPLDNAEEVHGNMVILTNERSQMSAVALARVAKESGAAALMIVNVNPDHPDTIYSLQPESEEERLYAEEHIDIPVIMVSLASGNLISTSGNANAGATADPEYEQDEDHLPFALPGRVRLYAAGDRPYFEDAISQNPILYLIHNLLNQQECQSMIQMAEGKFSVMDDTLSNLLEHTVASEDRSTRAKNVQKAVLWRGKLGGHFFKQMDERIEQVTGYPQNQLSDWIVLKYEHGSSYDLHLDLHTIHPPVATIVVFLNDLENLEESLNGKNSVGGEIVYPKAGAGKTPIKVMPKEGLAVVHHNVDFNGDFDLDSIHGEFPYLGNGFKYIAMKYVYSEPVSSTQRIVLPLLSWMNAGRLPRWVITVHDFFLAKFGLAQGYRYFEKACKVIPMILIGLLAQYIYSLVQSDKKNTKDKKE